MAENLLKTVSHQKNQYLIEVNNELFNINNKILEINNDVWTKEFYTELYFTIKKIHDISALFGFKDLFEISTYLLKKLKIDHFDYCINPKDKKFVRKGISFLLKLIEDFEEGKDSEKNAAINRLEFVDKRKVNDLNHSIQRNEMKELLQKEWFRFIGHSSRFCLLYITVDQNTGNLSLFNYLATNKPFLRKYDEIRLWNQKCLLILLPEIGLQGATIIAKKYMDLIKHEKNATFQSGLKMGVMESEPIFKKVDNMVHVLEKTMNRKTKNGLYIFPLFKEKNKQTLDDKKLKVLIIDNDPITPTLIQNYLLAEEWEVEIVLDTDKVNEKVFAWNPDFILSETKTEDFDGYLFCQELRQIPKFNRIPFIFISEHVLSHQISRGFHVGADDYITKPFAMEELEARMKRLKEKYLGACHT